MAEKYTIRFFTVICPQYFTCHFRNLCIDPPRPENIECGAATDNFLQIQITPPSSQFVIQNYFVTYTSLLTGFSGSFNETVAFSDNAYVTSNYSNANPGVTYYISVYSVVTGAKSAARSVNCTSGMCFHSKIDRFH
jgi:hypothetical protein